MLVPPVGAKPATALVVDDSQRYVYAPLPPVGVLPVSGLGDEPEQTVCAALIVLVLITGVTVIATAVVTSVHKPDVTTLLYQVLTVNAPTV